MKGRPGRKSAASQAVVSLVNLDDYRPDPPDYLTEEQATEWGAIVGSMKAGTFPPSVWPLLSLYCTFICRARFIELQLRKADPKKDLDAFKMWLTMERDVTSVLCQLATKLRLLVRNNTRMDRQQSTESSTPWLIRKKPWEDDSDDDTPEPAA